MFLLFFSLLLLSLGLKMFENQQKLFLKVESLLCLPHPQSVKKYLLCTTGERLLFGEKKKKPLGLRKYGAMHESFFFSQLLLSPYS